MQGTQKIIDDILASARSAAQALVTEAQSEADARSVAVKAELEQAYNAALEKLEAEADDVYKGQAKLGELEAGKALLKAKQECVGAVYDGVRKKILAASDKEYLALLQKLIVSVCEDGDEVIAAQADKARVTSAWVKKVSEAAKKKLTLSKTYGEFSGGVVLRNGKFDRDLTVDELVSDLKERTVADTVKYLGL